MSVVRCPSCAAGVPVGAEWCTLCWADLRPAAAARAVPVPVAGVEAAAPPAAPDPLTAPIATLTAPAQAPVAAPASLEPAAGPRWPCVCGERNSFEQLTCPTCGHRPLSGPPLPPALRLDDPRARLGVMLGGGAAVLVVVTLLLVLLGQLL